MPLPFPTDTEMLLIVLFWMSQGIKNFFSKASPCLSLLQKSFFVYIPQNFIDQVPLCEYMYINQPEIES